MKNAVVNSAFLIGAALFIYGVYQISEPWAFIVLGLGMATTAVLVAIYIALKVDNLTKKE